MMSHEKTANAVHDGAPATESQRTTVRSFESYSEAERAVEYLTTRKFPVDRVAVVGRDVRWVEQIVGRTNYGYAALNGAASGAVVGALFGWIFGLLTWIHPLIAGLALAAYGLVFGAVVGAVLGVALYTLRRGRRDFESVRVLQPDRYELVADAEVAAEAAALLDQRYSAAPAATTPASVAPQT
jgi:hypothetical protein